MEIIKSKTAPGFLFKDMGKDYAILHEQTGEKILGWISRKAAEYEKAKS